MRAFHQSQTEDSYTREVELSFPDCDRNKRLRPAKLLSLLASVAGYDYDARGLTHERLCAMGEAFMLSRVALRIHRCPLSGDVLRVTTWEDGTHGARLRRVYEAEDAAGALTVSAKTEWVLVNPAERKILRPDSFHGKPITVCPKTVDAPECRRLALPREGAAALCKRPVRWSDLDGNGHVHSGTYGDIVWDALPPALQDAPLAELFINYSHEATLGETLTLRGLQVGNTYQMEGLCEEEVCFSCACVFA